MKKLILVIFILISINAIAQRKGVFISNYNKQTIDSLKIEINIYCKKYSIPFTTNSFVFDSTAYIYIGDEGSGTTKAIISYLYLCFHPDNDGLDIALMKGSEIYLGINKVESKKVIIISTKTYTL